MEVNDVFHNLSSEFCDEHNHDFLELFDSSNEGEPDDGGDVVQAIYFFLPNSKKLPINLDFLIMLIPTLFTGLYTSR